jgi:hypothetical protein
VLGVLEVTLLGVEVAVGVETACWGFGFRSGMPRVSARLGACIEASGAFSVFTVETEALPSLPPPLLPTSNAATNATTSTAPAIDMRAGEPTQRT